MSDQIHADYGRDEKSNCGLSWNGFNVWGDRKSIDEVRAAIHAKDSTVPSLRQTILNERAAALATQPQAPQVAVKWEEVGTLHVQHYLNAPEMENREYVPIVDLPPGSHKLYAAIEAPAGDKK